MSQLVFRFVSAWQLVARRSLAHWRILSSVGIGVLLASTIMAGTAIYFDSLRELALRHELGKHSANELDILSAFETRPTSYREYERVSAVAKLHTELHLGWLLQDSIGAVKTATFALATPGEEDVAGVDDRRAYFAFAPRLQQYATVLPGGSLPREQPLSSPGEPLELEAIVPLEAARLLNVSVGDRLSVVPYWEEAEPYARVVISGIFRRNDPEEEFWYLFDRVLQAGTVMTVRTVPFLISERAYLGVLGPTFRNVDSTYAWLLDVDTDRLNAGNSSRVLSDIELAQRSVHAAVGGYRLSTLLLAVLNEYDVRLFFTKVPMLVFLVLITAVVLYYVVTLSSLLVDRQRAEVALLRSRGASSGQLVAVFALEGATISVIAAAAGPLLAAGAIKLLGLTPAFSELSGNELLSVSVSRGAYSMGALGGLLSFAALMVAGVQASRVGVTRHRQQAARPSRLPVFQRYYLDVLLLLAGIVLFRQLTEQGSVLATGLFGDVAVNQALLAVPALVLVAAAMILLRLFPVAMSLISRVSSRRLPAGPALGLWQMSRNPAHYARVSLLLILTAGLGVFGASFVGTLDRSFEERVLYSTGSDIRIEGVRVNPEGLSRNPAGSYEKSGSIAHASAAYRGRAADVTKPRGKPFTMLAVDEESFAKVAWLRDDFSSKPLADLLRSLRQPNPPEGIKLPAVAATLGVVLKADKAAPDVWVTARIKDVNDRYSTYRLGPLGLPDLLGNLKKPSWLDLAASIEPRHRLAGPITLVSLAVHATQRRGRLQRGSILIDEITAGTLERDGSQTRVKKDVLEPFDGTLGWSILQLTQKALSDDLQEAAAGLDGGSGLVRFTWNDDEAMTGHGIFHGPQLATLPVLASKSFLSDMGYHLGEELSVSLGRYRISVRLVDTIDFFPTLDPSRERFIVADLVSLVRSANLDPLADEFQPNEVWLSLEPGGIDRGRLVEQLYSEPFESKIVYDRAKQLAEFKVDPLARAGWSALLFIAFSAVLVLSCVGFLVHAYVSFREREGQLAIMTSVGLSVKQLVTLVWLEQVLVIAAGMTLGTWMGVRLVGTIMPFLGHDDRGGQVVPPFVVDVNWGTLAITYAAMALVFALIMTGTVWLIGRISLQRILRMGEM